MNTSDDSKPSTLPNGGDLDSSIGSKNADVIAHHYIYDSHHFPKQIDFAQPPVYSNNIFAAKEFHCDDRLKLSAGFIAGPQPSTRSMNNPQTFYLHSYNSATESLLHKPYESVSSTEQYYSSRRRRRRYSHSLHYDDTSASSHNTKECSSLTPSEDSNLLRANDDAFVQTSRNSFIPSVDSLSSINSVVHYHSDPSIWQQNIPDHHSFSNISSQTLSPKKIRSIYPESNESLALDADYFVDEIYQGDNSKEIGTNDSFTNRIKYMDSLDYSNHVLDILNMSAVFLTEQDQTNPSQYDQLADKLANETKPSTNLDKENDEHEMS